MPQLAPLSLVAPGSRGLNTEKEFNLLSPQWATQATNCVLTDGGRLGARKGWSDQTATGISGSHSIDVLFEYQDDTDTRVIISAANNKLYKNISDFTDVANDITSTTVPTADNWKFVNFNGKALGFQTGHNPISRTSGDFADISITSTGQPVTPDPGNEALAAFGRVWFVDEDGQTIWYTALLDETDMTTANGAGLIDMTSVWTMGMDKVVAIAALGSNLIVFGQNHIIIWSDGSGSDIGIDPTQIYVTDTIEGTGCIARDSVQLIGEGDLWFLSRHGIQSLKRVMNERTNPLVSITKNVQTSFVGQISTERASDTNLDAVRSVYSPEEQFYLLFLPGLDVIWCIDTGAPFRDEDGDIGHAIFEWNMGGSIKCGLSRRNGDLLFGSSGVVGKYQDYQDDSSAYTMAFWSGWLDFGPELNNRLKMLKEMSVILQVGGGSAASFRWEFDWTGDTDSYTVSYSTPGSAEYGTAEFTAGVGESGYVGTEYAGGLSIQRKNFPASNQGQYIRVGSTVAVNAFNFILQQIQLVPKLGRMVI